MNAAAAAAADFKSSFTPQFNGLMQPFGSAATAADEAALYAAGYAPPTYNSWASKVPSPLAATAKSFPWGLNSVNMSPLGAAGFNPVAPVGQMVNSSIGMSTMATMSNSLGMASQAAGPCMQHYSSPPNHYASYRDQCGPPPPPPPTATVPTVVPTSASSAALRFNKTNNNSAAKTSSSSSSSSSTSSSGSNSSAGLLSGYGQPGSPRSNTALTACQYAGADRSPV